MLVGMADNWLPRNSSTVRFVRPSAKESGKCEIKFLDARNSDRLTKVDMSGKSVSLLLSKYSCVRLRQFLIVGGRLLSPTSSACRIVRAWSCPISSGK